MCYISLSSFRNSEINSIINYVIVKDRKLILNSIRVLLGCVLCDTTRSDSVWFWFDGDNYIIRRRVISSENERAAEGSFTEVVRIAHDYRFEIIVFADISVFTKNKLRKYHTRSKLDDY